MYAFYHQLQRALLVALLGSTTAMAEPINWSCSAAELTAADGCLLSDGRVAFSLQATSGSSISTLSLTPSGLAYDSETKKETLDGNAYLAELADLDGNGWPEVYVYVSSAGSGSYGSLVGYAVNNGKSATPVYLPPLDQTPGATAGYMGHDLFRVGENRLLRRFPLYLPGDTNSRPGGGMRQLQYRLEAGEAGWVLAVDKVVDY